MKNSKLTKGVLAVLLIFTVFVTVAFARATEDRDNWLWTGTHSIVGLTNILFEGAIRDGTNITTLTITEPTAARTITVPDGDVTLGNTDAHTTATSITVVDTTTNTVTDLLTLDHSGGNTTTGFGTGISFKLEDDTGTTTEEHANIDVVITTPTSTTEDSQMNFGIMSNGDVATVLTLQGASSTTTGDSIVVNSGTDDANGIIDTILIDLSSSDTPAAGLGAAIVFRIDDATPGVEEQGSIDVVLTTATSTQEDADFVFRQNSNGTIVETLRLVADADGTVEGDRMEFTSSSAETNGVNDLLVLKASGGTTVAGFGVGVDYQAEFADGVETACTTGAVWTDVGTGSEDADFVFSCKDAGAAAELVRFDSDGQILMEGATSDGIQLILAVGTDPAATDKTITLPSTTSAAAMISALTTNDVDVANSIWGVSNGLAFGGATGANTFEVTVSPGADPGADVALTLPTASGAIPTVIGASSVKTVETITATDPQLLADCGKTLILTHATVPIIVTLPAISGSSGCEFWIRHGLATNQDHTVVTESSDNIIMGSTVDNNTPPGSYQAAGDLVTFVNSVESVGDYIHVISNGVNWFLDGVAELNGGITQGST